MKCMMIQTDNVGTGELLKVICLWLHAKQTQYKRKCVLCYISSFLLITFKIYCKIRCL